METLLVVGMLVLLCPSGLEWGKGGLSFRLPWWIPVLEHLGRKIRTATEKKEDKPAVKSEALPGAND